MHPQLEAIVREFQRAQDRLDRLAGDLRQEEWHRRPLPDRWSPGECVAHLNLTGRLFLPVLERGIEEARSRGGAAPERYRRDPIGWLLWRVIGPPARLKTRTAAAFVPGSRESAAELLATFADLQRKQVALVRAAEGLPIQKVRIVSPFDARVRYNLYAAFTVLPRHQQRHLWQAEQAVAAPA